MFHHFSSLFLSAGLIATFADAQLSLFNATSAPGSSSLSSGCISALSASISCDPVLFSYATSRTTGAIDDNTLANTLCPATCKNSLLSYRNKVAAACPTGPVPGFPATYDADFILAYQNQTCLKDSSSGKWCHSYLANLTVSSTTARSKIEDLPNNDKCSDCVVQTFILAQGTGFSHYDNQTAASWAAVQSACSLQKAYPTTVPKAPSTSLLVPFGSGTGLNISTGPAPSCLSGKTYTVASTDTCQSISQKFQVSTGVLQILNGLYSDCSNLVTGQNLCLPSSCTTYTVQTNDNCSTIARAHSISKRQIASFNGNVDNDCTNLVVGQSICLSAPAGPYKPATIPGIQLWPTYPEGTYTGPQGGGNSSSAKTSSATSTSKSTSTATTPTTLSTSTKPTLIATTVPPPAPTPSGTISICFKWHIALLGDSCTTIEKQYGVTLAQLEAWNPILRLTILACDLLLIGQAYCVSATAIL